MTGLSSRFICQIDITRKLPKEYLGSSWRQAQHRRAWSIMPAQQRMSHQVDINRAPAGIAQGCAFAKRTRPWAVIRSNMHPAVKVQECGSAPSLGEPPRSYCSSPAGRCRRTKEERKTFMPQRCAPSAVDRTIRRGSQVQVGAPACCGGTGRTPHCIHSIRQRAG